MDDAKLPHVAGSPQIGDTDYGHRHREMV
jgi:hypothetical protein